MQDLNDKVTGGTLTATEWNQIPSEVQNVIEKTGIALSAGDLDQLGKAVANYVGAGDFYTESGAADAYVLATVGSKQAPSAYANGMRIRFVAGNDNTGASTINVASLGVKNLKNEDGSDLIFGDIQGSISYEFYYDGTDFILGVINHAFAVGDLFRYIPTNLHAGIRDRTGTTDLTAHIQNALDTAFTLGLGGVHAGDGEYLTEGTLIGRAGVTLYGNTTGSEYYPGEATNAVNGAEFVKSAAGIDGPIIIRSTADGLKDVYLKHLKVGGATTGIIQMGAVGSGVSCYNTDTRGVRLYGHLTADITGVTTCFGLYYPDSTSPAQRYFNHGDGIRITNVDIPFHLGEESNGNNYSHITTRQCYSHYELDGGAGACVDNIFTGLGLFNIGSLPTTQETCFVMKNGAQWNSFTGYQTEINGREFDVDATSTLNQFVGQANEPDPSFLPVGGIAGPDQGGIHSKFQRPLNAEQYSQMLLPVRTTGDRFDQILGSKFSMFQLVDGAANGLPALDGAGALVAATAHSRSIVQFNIASMEKSVEPNFRCKLTIFVQAAGTSGQAMCTVDFMYVCTNTTTNAGVLRVLSAQLAPAAGNYIAGLKFISGVTGGTEFRIAMVGGNLSAALAARISVSMEIEHYKAGEIATNDFVNIGFISTAATANDVTDAIDLLAVADTII